MAFDVEGAKKAGYSDAEIADYLAKQSETDQQPRTPEGVPTTPEEARGDVWLPPGSDAATRSVLTDPVDRASAAVGRIGQAAAEGWRGAPSIPSPEPSSGLGVNLPLTTIANTALSGAGALFRGGQQLAQEVTPDIHLPALPPGWKIPLGGNRQISGELTPGSLGREVAALPEAFPTGEGRGTIGVRPAAPQSYTEARAGAERGNLQVRPSAPPPVSLEELNAAIQRTDVPANRLAPKPVAPPAAEPDGQPGGLRPDVDPTKPFTYNPPSTGWPAGTERWAGKQAEVGTTERPGAAGAQITPAAELGMTPAEEAAYRSTAEGNKLLEPHEPGVRDDKVYLTGERINEAEASQDVETARQLKSLRQQTPELDKEMAANEAHNDNVRTNAIHNAIPGQVQITAAKTARQQAMETAEPRVFANATDADVRPIARDIEDELSAPINRQNTQLRQHVRPLIDRLMNEDGTPKITDAKELWSFRQDVQHLTSKDAQSADPNLRRVSGILGKVIETIDDRIEAAAPGYKAGLRDDYRTRSREIDAMEALNAERFKLFDSQNKPNYNAVQSLMRRIVDARQANDAYDPFTHVTQETLDKLWNIRDSMKRSVAADRLAAPKGSPTSQNIGDALRMAGKGALTAAAPAVGAVIGNWVLPGVGGTVGGITAGTAVNHLLSQRGLTQRLAQGRGMLNRNQLGP